jgi:hypothetical protein
MVAAGVGEDILDEVIAKLVTGNCSDVSHC